MSVTAAPRTGRYPQVRFPIAVFKVSFQRTTVDIRDHDSRNREIGLAC